MRQISTIAFPLLALIGWTLTVVLVVNLMGGVFDSRSCQTECFQALYWSALATALAGFTANMIYCIRYAFTPLLTISALALFALLGILLTTALIGSM